MNHEEEKMSGKKFAQKIRAVYVQKNGEIMVEAMVVVVFVVFILFMLLELSFFLFQQVNMVISANDVVTRMAQTYRLVDSDYLIGFVEPNDITSVSPYRYFIGGSKNEFDTVAAQKCSTLVQYRLSTTSLLSMEGKSTAQTKVVADALGRRHLELTITVTYKVPLLAIMKFFTKDISDDCTCTMTTTARAECPDLIDYIGTINTTNQMLNNPLDSKGVDMLNQFIKMCSSIRKAEMKVLGEK